MLTTITSRRWSKDFTLTCHTFKICRKCSRMLPKQLEINFKRESKLEHGFGDSTDLF